MENNIHTHTYIYIYIYVHIYKHEHTFIVAMVFVNCWFINGILDQNMHLIAYVRAQLEKWKINLLPWADDRLNPVTKFEHYRFDRQQDVTGHSGGDGDEYPALMAL